MKPRRYPPWEFMLLVDEVNYSLSEQLAVQHRLGEPIVNISSGVSYYPTFNLLLQEVARAIDCPSFHQDYDGPEGHPMGRRAIQTHEYFLSRHGLDLSDEHVLITAGASTAMHLLSLYFAEVYPDAEILVPVPTFPLAGASMAFAGLSVREVFHRREGRLLPTLLDYQAALGERTRLLFLNIFNNPSGECYEEQELTEIIRWSKQVGLISIIDKVSIDMVQGTEVPNVLDIAYEQNYLDHLIIVSSLSKDRCLPGFRIGWIIASPKLITELARYNALISVCPAAPTTALLFMDMLCRTVMSVGSQSQGETPDRVAIARMFVERALTFAPLAPGLADFLKPYMDPRYLNTLFGCFADWHAELMDLLQRNWRLITDDLAGCFVIGAPWRGGFNTFVRMPSLDQVDPYHFTVSLFRQRGIQILPGPSFGGTLADWRSQYGFWIRLSFAMETAKLNAGLERLVSFAQEYKAQTPQQQ